MQVSSKNIVLLFLTIFFLVLSMLASFAIYNYVHKKENQSQKLNTNYAYLKQPMPSAINADVISEEYSVDSYHTFNNERQLYLKDVIVDEEYGADEYDTLLKISNIPRKKVIITNEVRNSYIIPVPMTIEKSLKIKNKCYLDFGISVYHKPKGGVRFLVGIREQNKIYPFLIKCFGQRQIEEERTWYDMRIDLSSYTNKIIKIVFDFKNVNPVSLGDKASNTKEQKFAFLSDPILISKSKKTNDPNIILISIDTLRQDHLGCYGYSRDTSPNIDNLLKDKQTVIFDDVISQSHWTLPSHMSMITSQYASTHQIYMNRILKKESITFPMILKKNNFLNYGFVTHVRVSPKYGFERGFDSFWYEEHNFAKEKARVQDVVPKILEFLEKYRYNKFFLFIHLFDVHGPFTPPIPFDTIFDKEYFGSVSGYDSDLFAKPADNIFTIAKNKISTKDLQHLVNLYDGEIRYVDFHLGSLFSYLKKLNLFDNSLIIITSDHGEEFREHGSMGHNTLYDEVIKIPLIIKMPKKINVTNRRIDENLIQGNVDIAPTILDILNINIPDDFQGNSMLPIIKGLKNISSYQVSEKLSDWDMRTYQIAVRDISNKYIYTTFFDIKNLKDFRINNEKFELYDRINDKNEKNNLALSKDKMKLYYQNLVDNFIFKNALVNVDIPKKIEIEKKVKERLRSLGYIR